VSTTKEWLLDDAAAQFYETHFVPALFGDWADRLVKAAAIQPGERVLDVACGTGIVARHAAEATGTADGITGVDLSPSMLNMAERARPDIDWREGNAMHLPVESESVDVVLSQAALMFIPDPVGAVREMYRVLYPDGRIAVQVWGDSAGYMRTADVLDEIAGKEIADIFRTPFSLRDAEEASEIIVEGGFTEFNLDTQKGAAVFPSLRDFFATEIDGWVLAGRVDVDALLAAAGDRLAEYVQADGSVHIPIEGHVFTVAK